MKTFAWIVFALLSTGVGIYPVLYVITDMSQGLLSFKPDVVLNQTGFKIAYLHLHRKIGKTYVLACIISGIGGFYLAFYATGGTASELGFAILAFPGYSPPQKAYLAIRAQRIQIHQARRLASNVMTSFVAAHTM